MLELIWVGLLLWTIPSFSHSILPTESPPMSSHPQAEPVTLNYQYEASGFFDKDAQGWCSTQIWVKITSDQQVRIQEWFDENGIIRADTTYTGNVIEQDQHRLTIQLQKIPPGSSFYVSSSGLCFYDRGQQRLLTESPEKDSPQTHNLP